MSLVYDRKLEEMARYNLGDLNATWRAAFPSPLIHPSSDPAAVASLAPLRDTEVDRDVIAPEHTREIFDPTLFATVVEWAVAEVKAGGYEAVAGSGHSGLPLCGAVSYRLGIPMIAVRKDDERPKGDSYRVNGVLPHRPLRYAIIDDFICSGETIERIDAQVAYKFPQATLAGLVLYRVRADDPETRYSFVDDCRSSVARRIGVERAKALKIHARHNLPY